MKKGSETKIIKRSQINLNPCNPKHHTDAEIKQQKANIRKVGLLGGIQWNESTGNLIDGHKRVMSCDLIQGYDGTIETDYDIKVEAVDFDEKTEKEQMVFQAKATTSRLDYNVIASFIDEIDSKVAGFTELETEQIKQLQEELDKTINNDIDDFADDFLYQPTDKPQVTELPDVEKTSDEIVAEHAEKPKMSREEVREQKQHCTNVAMNRQESIDNFVFVEFESLEQKQLFCDMLNMVAESSMRITGNQLLSLL